MQDGGNKPASETLKGSASVRKKMRARGTPPEPCSQGRLLEKARAEDNDPWLRSRGDASWRQAGTSEH